MNYAWKEQLGFAKRGEGRGRQAPEKAPGGWVTALSFQDGTWKKDVTSYVFLTVNQGPLGGWKHTMLPLSWTRRTHY